MPGPSLPFERVELLAQAGPDEADAAFPLSSTRLARAELFRGETLSAAWRLCRLSHPGAASRVFVFPEPDVAQPPASLWLANLRALALDAGWCGAADAWCEVARSGWAGYDFNRIQERSFTPAGGAVDAGSSASWRAYAEAAGLPVELLCALPWDGLPGMWGPTHAHAFAAREAMALRAAASDSESSGKGKSRARSGRGSILKA